MASSSSNEKVEEFVVRKPKSNALKSFHVMKFNASLNVDPAKWTQVRMVRENARRDSRGDADEADAPKFGAGSEFGRDRREAVRRQRYGGKKRDPDMSPWLMRIGSKKEGRQFRGMREGGVFDNSAYYVFTHEADGVFEAHRLKEWYNFTPRVTYRTLDAEEAEERFKERGRILNHFAIMVNKKVKKGDNDDFMDDDMDADGNVAKDKNGKKKNGKKSGSEFKISDMDDYLDSDIDDDLDSDDDIGGGKKKKKGGEDGEGEKGGKGSKKGKNKKNTKKKKDDEEEKLEGLEDSDDGDDEGREVDYMSDESSESEEELNEQANIKGVDQDKGLAKLLDSDESEEEDEEEKKDEDNDDNKNENKDGGDNKGKKGDTNDETSSSGKDSKAERAEKRKAMVQELLDPNQQGSSKKARFEGNTSNSNNPSNTTGNVAPGGLDATLEEDVRRYLLRKPMTATEILKKITSRRGVTMTDDLMKKIVDTIKRINPHKQKVKGVMYLSLKN